MCNVNSHYADLFSTCNYCSLVMDPESQPKHGADRVSVVATLIIKDGEDFEGENLMDGSNVIDCGARRVILVVLLL